MFPYTIILTNGYGPQLLLISITKFFGSLFCFLIFRELVTAAKVLQTFYYFVFSLKNSELV